MMFYVKTYNIRFFLNMFYIFKFTTVRVQFFFLNSPLFFNTNWNLLYFQEIVLISICPNVSPSELAFTYRGTRLNNESTSVVIEYRELGYTTIFRVNFVDTLIAI